MMRGDVNIHRCYAKFPLCTTWPSFHKSIWCFYVKCESTSETKEIQKKVFKGLGSPQKLYQYLISNDLTTIMLIDRKPGLQYQILTKGKLDKIRAWLWIFAL